MGAGYPGAPQIAMMFGLALLLFRPPRRTIVAWLAIGVFIVGVGLFIKPSLALIAVSSHAESSGRIYVYAQRLTATRSWIPIAIDNIVVAKIKRGTFFSANMAPGLHTVTIENGIPAFVEVGSGQESYVRVGWIHLEGPPFPALSIMPQDLARKEMRFLSYIEAGKIVSTSVSRTDPRQPEEPLLKTRQ